MRQVIMRASPIIQWYVVNTSKRYDQCEKTLKGNPMPSKLEVM